MFPGFSQCMPPSQFLIRQKEMGTLTAKKSGHPAGSTDALDSLSCSRIQSCSTVAFAVKSPFCFCFMRNCERNVCFGKTGIIRSPSRIEYTGDAGYGILVTRRNLSEKPGIGNLMLMPEMKLSEQREFSSQALLLIRSPIPGFSKISKRSQNSIPGISVPFYPGTSEYFPIFLNLRSFRRIRIFLKFTGLTYFPARIRIK